MQSDDAEEHLINRGRGRAECPVARAHRVCRVRGAGRAVELQPERANDRERVGALGAESQTVEKLEDAVANSAAGLRIMISDPGALEALRNSLEGKRGRGRVTLVVPMEKEESEVEVTLPGTYSIAGGLRDVIGMLPGVSQVEEI